MTKYTLELTIVAETELDFHCQEDADRHLEQILDQINNRHLTIAHIDEATIQADAYVSDYEFLPQDVDGMAA